MAKKLTENKVNKIIRIAKKYYELGLSQEKIAEQEYISKSTVSRLLNDARDMRYISIIINYPKASKTELEDEINSLFDIESLCVVPSYTENLESRLADTCKAFDEDFFNLLSPDDIISISWGSTMEFLTQSIINSTTTTRKKCSKVVLMNGSLAGEISSLKSSFSVKELSQFLNAKGYILPVPLILDSPAIAQAIYADSHIIHVIEYARQSEIALFSVGAIHEDSILKRRGAYTEEEYQQIVQLGAIGDINGRCYDIRGNEVGKELSNRMIALTIDEIKRKKHRICVAVGENKALAIIGALNGGIINHLYTDEITAKEIVRFGKNLQKKSVNHEII